METGTNAGLLVTLTPSAAARIRELVSKEGDNAGKHLRVYVEAGGCSGMQYGMVFDERRDGDLGAEQQGLVVLVDPVSAGHLGGSVVDFSDELNGGGFKITNPRARQSCGCGKSFEA